MQNLAKFIGVDGHNIRAKGLDSWTEWKVQGHGHMSKGEWA